MSGGVKRSQESWVTLMADEEEEREWRSVKVVGSGGRPETYLTHSSLARWRWLSPIVFHGDVYPSRDELEYSWRRNPTHRVGRESRSVGKRRWWGRRRRGPWEWDATWEETPDERRARGEHPGGVPWKRLEGGSVDQDDVDDYFYRRGRWEVDWDERRRVRDRMRGRSK